MIIYIIGRMRGLHRYGYQAFHDAESRLRELGWSTINPHVEDLTAGFDVTTYNPTRYGLDWNDYPPVELFDRGACRKRCERAVELADALFVLKGGLGEGGLRELEHAILLGKNIHYEQDGYPMHNATRTHTCATPAETKKTYHNAKSDILNAAIQHVCGDRDQSYGPAYVHHGKLAAAANAIFGTSFTAADIGKLWIIDKIIRSLESPHKRDHYEDIAGYSACSWECAEMELKEGEV